MRLYPAIDVLGGSAVRLVRGDFEAKKVYDEDPLSAARTWVSAGAEYLHVVDLDGAKRGEPVNLGQLRRLAAGAGVPVQYGGGLRSPGAVARALSAGAARVILGTVAFTDPDVLRAALDAHGAERVLVGVDVRAGRVATHGWLHSTDTPAREAFAALRELGARDFVFTNIDHDGMLDGANREEVAWVARAAAAGEGSVIVSGGIGTLAHLRELARVRGELALDGLDGVIVGTALYERRFTVAQAKDALTLR
ncbi:MAG TPA: 1-(5-phosphoribosyl)-5-[(5-phosphoribosylamino)methylideneamino] imidazole-4-carboxamide isomerase [Solirubrobacteraceae bacterium]|nr:1-(5-phosphoribosyl)-5-[(5-phosphoribosylamino)methylideneamino] imidazole-4-carboxamide isomerase [Solirubrobacteraceae bacterium]